MRPAHIELWEAGNGRWYFHVKHSNGNITDANDYAYKSSAKRRIRQKYPDLEIVEMDGP